jgi:DNA/RNA endonuclease YhcR with UshA esterase domain
MRLNPDIRWAPRWKGAVVALVAAVTVACASVPGRPSIQQVQSQSGRFVDHSVTVRGRVTSSWGVPLVGFNVYRVEDGTGEITVVSTEKRVPSRGAEVEVKGKVEDVAVLAGRPLGLHLREQRLRYR